MAITRKKKEGILADLKDKFKDAKSIVFSDYRGLSVQDMEDLRRTLREKNVSYKVAKKTLVRLAAADAGYKEIPTESMEGPVGVAFSYEDEVAAAKTLGDLGKKFEGLKLLGGLMDGDVLSIEKVQALSEMPSKEELLSRLIGSLQSPASGLANVLSGSVRNLVYVLEAHRQKLSE
ncbi:50S ribosomal protein L10 [Patescibacteria group bacterium]|nr:50S ribosomal protein L10 [Patescibacteria group bacterium]MBU1019328.1 50S ribosomal protein L10 [Patescibacteria group bacterium]